MIYGVGTDLIEIKRIEKACSKQTFLFRAFTEEERRQSEGNISKLAGNFAVKEAVSKAFGTGFRGIELNEIEVLRDEIGKPYVKLYNNAKRVAIERNIIQIHVSISNTKEQALAFVVMEGE